MAGNYNKRHLQGQAYLDVVPQKLEVANLSLYFPLTGKSFQVSDGSVLLLAVPLIELSLLTLPVKRVKTPKKNGVAVKVIVPSTPRVPIKGSPPLGARRIPMRPLICPWLSLLVMINAI